MEPTYIDWLIAYVVVSGVLCTVLAMGLGTRGRTLVIIGFMGWLLLPLYFKHLLA